MKEQTPMTDKVLDNILFEISLCSSEYHKREVLKEEINAKVLEALEREFSQVAIFDKNGKSKTGIDYYETEVKTKYK